jgi:cyanophycinase
MDVLREFVRLSGGPEEARIVVMSAASTDHEAQDRKYRDAFGRLGVANFRALETGDRQDADRAKSLAVVDWATGIFFTGGDQKRIRQVLDETRLERELHRRYGEGLVIAGTSAGASMMSEVMLDEGYSEESPRTGVVQLGLGMGFLPGVIVDQHFSQRGRLGRLLGALAERPQDLAVGIDEDTAMVVEGDVFRVVGSGVVTVLDGSHLGFSDRAERGEGETLTLSGITLHTIGAGNGFDLASRALLPSSKGSVRV